MMVYAAPSSNVTLFFSLVRPCFIHIYLGAASDGSLMFYGEQGGRTIDCPDKVVVILYVMEERTALGRDGGKRHLAAGHFEFVDQNIHYLE